MLLRFTRVGMCHKNFTNKLVKHVSSTRECLTISANHHYATSYVMKMERITHILS